MTVALRQLLRQGQLVDPTMMDHVANTQTRAEAGTGNLSFAGAREQRWSFQRMIVVASAISIALWFGVGAVVWKALT